MSGPTDEARRVEILQGKRPWIFGIGLRGIEGDDFQIMPLTEGEKSVLRAAARMHATESRADSGAPLNKVDSTLQVLAAEKNVIQQGWNLRSLSEKKRRNNQSASRQGKKK